MTLILVALCACSRDNYSAVTNTIPAPKPTGPVQTDPTNPTGCPLQNFGEGVDVSNYQPDTSWSTAVSNGVQFAFIKATEGVTIINGDFSTDWSATAAQGIIHGAYHYFHPSDDAAQAAQIFLSTVGSLAPADLPPMFDWETSDSLPAATVIANAQTWLDAVENATGRTPVIYTNPNYWSSIGHPPAFARYPLFIADYIHSCPEVPAPWTSWTFWQYGQGPVTGITTTVDLDFFNGSFATLENFILTPQ